MHTTHTTHTTHKQGQLSATAAAVTTPPTATTEAGAVAKIAASAAATEAGVVAKAVAAAVYCSCTPGHRFNTDGDALPAAYTFATRLELCLQYSLDGWGGHPALPITRRRCR